MKALLLSLLLISQSALATDIYSFVDQIPLSYSRNVGTGNQSGLTVTVLVQNAVTGSTLLSSTSVPESTAGSGVYTYNWTHGLKVDTLAMVIFTVGTSKYTEYLFFNNDASGRSAF